MGEQATPESRDLVAKHKSAEPPPPDDSKVVGWSEVQSKQTKAQNVAIELKKKEDELAQAKAAHDQAWETCQAARAKKDETEKAATTPRIGHGVRSAS